MHTQVRKFMIEPLRDITEKKETMTDAKNVKIARNSSLLIHLTFNV